MMKVVFLFIISYLGSDHFLVRQKADEYLRLLVNLTDDVSVVHKAMLDSDDLEIKVRCKRIYENYTLDLVQEMAGKVYISKVKEKHFRYMPKTFKLQWKQNIEWQTLQTWEDEQIDIQHGNELLMYMVAHDLGRKDLRYFWKKYNERK